MSILVAVVDGDSVIEYDRSKPLPARLLECLDKMDEKMDMSIPSGQGSVFAPDQEQKAQFVASQLMMAIERDDESLISASMAYLAIRVANLKQVSLKMNGEKKEITLVYDKEYVPAQTVNFVRPEHLNS
ncbi:hypothetical protein MNBD_GAMMA11-248 [hydrothermal vent metagenome]|uniref:Uncharacterized protein n=1 Tax=hydrothermal vent metagenome TaxID=652676 RepID=A0A3B0WUA4_9ZZZZ